MPLEKTFDLYALAMIIKDTDNESTLRLFAMTFLERLYNDIIKFINTTLVMKNRKPGDAGEDAVPVFLSVYKKVFTPIPFRQCVRTLLSESKDRAIRRHIRKSAYAIPYDEESLLAAMKSYLWKVVYHAVVDRCRNMVYYAELPDIFSEYSRRKRDDHKNSLNKNNNNNDNDDGNNNDECPVGFEKKYEEKLTDKTLAEEIPNWEEIPRVYKIALKLREIVDLNNEDEMFLANKLDVHTDEIRGKVHKLFSPKFDSIDRFETLACALYFRLKPLYKTENALRLILLAKNLEESDFDVLRNMAEQMTIAQLQTEVKRLVMSEKDEGIIAKKRYELAYKKRVTAEKKLKQAQREAKKIARIRSEGIAEFLCISPRDVDKYAFRARQIAWRPRPGENKQNVLRITKGRLLMPVRRTSTRELVRQ
jgi:hypothetical protein